MLPRQELTKAKRIVIKVGTSTLNYDTGKLNISRIEHLVRELSDLANQGKEIILVSSGAVGAGLERMKKYSTSKYSRKTSNGCCRSRNIDAYI